MAGTALRPTWEEFWSNVDGEDWLAAKALLELSVIRHDAEGWIGWAGSPDRLVPAMDWDGWVADVDERGRGWSSTEYRLFELVAALVIPGRTTRVVGVLDSLGSWEVDVWRILLGWAARAHGGNR